MPCSLYTFPTCFPLPGMDVQPGRGGGCRNGPQCNNPPYQDLPATKVHHQCQWRWRCARLEIPILGSLTNVIAYNIKNLNCKRYISESALHDLSMNGWKQPNGPLSLIHSWQHCNCFTLCETNHTYRTYLPLSFIILPVVYLTGVNGYHWMNWWMKNKLCIKVLCMATVSRLKHHTTLQTFSFQVIYYYITFMWCKYHFYSLYNFGGHCLLLYDFIPQETFVFLIVALE